MSTQPSKKPTCIDDATFKKYLRTGIIIFLIFAVIGYHTYTSNISKKCKDVKELQDQCDILKNNLKQMQNFHEKFKKEVISELDK